MPLVLNVNISKKVGEPDFGSRGASVSLQQELDSSLVSNPNQLQDQIQTLFRQAREAVEAELFGREAGMTQNGHGQNGSTSNGNGHHRQSNGRRATDSQVRALHAIANRQKIDLRSLLDRQYQIGRPEDLTLQEASQLIDDLNSESTQKGGRL